MPLHAAVKWMTSLSFQQMLGWEVLLQDDTVTTTIPENNKVGLSFLSVPCSDFPLGVKLAREPFPWRCSFLPQFSFHLCRVLSPRGSLPKILSRDKTISKQPFHQSPQRQCGLQAKALILEPEEKYSLHRRPVGIIHYWRQPWEGGWHSRNCGKFTLELNYWLIFHKWGEWQDRVKWSIASQLIWNFPWPWESISSLFPLHSSVRPRWGNL